MISVLCALVNGVTQAPTDRLPQTHKPSHTTLEDAARRSQYCNKPKPPTARAVARLDCCAVAVEDALPGGGRVG
jgi:hypothetical protein